MNKIKVGKRSIRSTLAVVLCWLGMLIFTFHACTHMIGAGDTWVGIACGRHIFNHGVDTTEPFSKNSIKAGPSEEDVKKWPKCYQWIADKVGLETVRYWHPTGWINQNWLTHLIFYWLTHESPIADAETFSFNSLVYWKFTIYVLTVICVYYMGKFLGAYPAISAIFACFAMFVGRSFLDIRPVGFSNLFIALFLFVLVLSTYRNILFIWLIIPIILFWCNAHEGYIYAFTMLVPFVTLNFISSFFPKKLVSIGLKGVCHTIAAGFIALFAVILVNPFHLTSLTQILEITLGKHSKTWRTINEWHPAFEWGNPVGDERPFLIMFILALTVLLIWIIILIISSLFISRSTLQKEDNSKVYQLPKIDLAITTVVALTIYMAICFRRFIPIAAIAACPVMAVFISDIIRMISASHSFYRGNNLTVRPLSHNLQVFFIIAGAVGVLSFGMYWGLKFKRIYLDPWPMDTRLNSVFVRMTNSDTKPFYACKFLKDNELKGKMFNYFTEGGFIAWGQEPSQKTGRIPLQIFIDGRAPSAFDIKTFRLWSEITAGGPIAQKAKKEKKELTAEDYIKIGQWADEKFKQYGIWVVSTPARMSNRPLLQGLDHNPSWRLVFLNDKQKIFVDTTTPQGQTLFEGIFDGKTMYPDNFSKNLITAHHMFLSDDAEASKEKALQLAIMAFNSNPSKAAMDEIMFGTRFQVTQPRVKEFCRNYLNELKTNKTLYAKQHGYANRLVAALIAADYLSKDVEEQNKEKAKFYAAAKQQYINERKRILSSKRW